MHGKVSNMRLDHHKYILVESKFKGFDFPIEWTVPPTKLYNSKPFFGGYKVTKKQFNNL